ncbi:MAG: flagellar basal body-associated FliL family protein [Thermodesulfobacteriota bacterium]
MADDKATSAEGQEAPKKSKLIFFIILGVTILLLGGGGFFAYTKFMAPKPAKVEEAKAEGEKGAPEPAIGQILPLDPFVVNLADPSGKRYLKLKVELELETPIALEKAKQVSPKLRDMVIMMLTSLSFEEVMTPEGKIRIRDELLERFNQVMRPDRIKNIYFTEFVVQ